MLATPAWLADHLDDPNLVVVDCPWEAAAYARAHVPGAVVRPGHSYVKAETDGTPGLHLPDADAFRTFTAGMGITPGATVVAYDDWGSLFAARLWWALRYYGHDTVMVLDGGWQAWVEAGLPVSCREVIVEECEGIDPDPVSERLATAAQVSAMLAGDRHVVDARSLAEFKGEAPHGNKRVGHVPGARHLEWNELLTNSTDRAAVRSFRPPDEVRARLEAAGITADVPAVTYCQAGVRGAFMAFALELAGYPVPSLFDGSMAEWANRDDLPLE